MVVPPSPVRAVCSESGLPAWLLDGDLDALIAVVDVQQRAAHAGLDAAADRLGVRHAVRGEAAGDAEAGVDQAQRQQHVHRRPLGAGVGDADAEVAIGAAPGRRRRPVRRRGALGAVQRVEQPRRLVDGDGVAFHQAQNREPLVACAWGVGCHGRRRVGHGHRWLTPG